MTDSQANIRLILSGCIDKNPLSEKRLFELYYGFVHAICRRYAHTVTECEEMLNDTFYTVFRYLNKFDLTKEFKPWLAKVSVNCCLQYLQKNKPKFEFSELDEYTEAFEPSINTQFINEQDGSVYLKMVQLLPTAYRMVFNLFVFDEYKHHEIAEILGISIGTSKSNLSRAKFKLEQMILEHKNRSLK